MDTAPYLSTRVSRDLSVPSCGSPLTGYPFSMIFNASRRAYPWVRGRDGGRASTTTHPKGRSRPRKII